MSVHLSLLSQMKTVSDSIYDVLRLVLLFLVALRRSEEATIARAQNVQICHSLRCRQIGMPTVEKFIAELKRAKRASEAAWVRKIDNSSSRENFLWRHRTNVLLPYRLLWRRKGVSIKRKRFGYVMPTAILRALLMYTVAYTFKGHSHQN